MDSPISTSNTTNTTNTDSSPNNTNTTGRNYIESIDPSNPLSNTPNTNEYIHTIVPGKKLVQAGGSIMLSHELSNTPDTTSYHHRFHNKATVEHKHSVVLSNSPNSFHRQPGQFGKYANAAAKSERMATWQSSSQRKSIEEERYAVLCPGPGIKKGHRASGIRGGSRNNNINNNTGGSSNNTGTYTPDTNSNTYNNTSSTNTSINTNTYSNSGTPHKNSTGSGSGGRGTFTKPRPPSPTKFQIESVDIQPYDIDDEISMTSHMSNATQLKSRHVNTRLDTISQFQHTFDKAKDNFRTEQIMTRELKRWKPKPKPDDQLIHDQVRNDVRIVVLKLYCSLYI